MAQGRYTANLEPVVSLLRVFEDGQTPMVDPYALAATVVYRNKGKTAEIRGMTSSRSIVVMRDAIRTAFRQQGVSVVEWMHNNKLIRVRI